MKKMVTVELETVMSKYEFYNVADILNVMFLKATGMQKNSYVGQNVTQTKGYDSSQVCVCTQYPKCDHHENAELQTLQDYGFSPVCIRIWPTKFDLSVNANSQISQE